MHEVQSYYALCSVLDSLIESRNTGSVSPEEMQAKIENYLIFRLDAYGVAWFPPKAHYALHLAGQLRKHGVLVSCYCHERKHKELKKFANQSHNAGATMAWEKGLLEDVLLQQYLALQEWSRRDVYMLTSPKPAHKELINFIASLGIHANDVQASLDASAKGEAISKGDIITYRDPAGLVVAEVWFHVQITRNDCKSLHTCVSPWKPLGHGRFESKHEPCWINMETIQKARAWKRVGSDALLLV